MDKRLLLIGGATLVAGGLAYWYLSQKPPSPPPPPPPPDDHGCYGDCFYEGATDCDRYSNLCKCVNGEWQLLERNSQKCVSGITHLECFPSQNNIATCIPIPGTGTDKCWNQGYSAGCSCVTAECDIFHICEPNYKACILKAETSINGIPGINMICDESDPGNHFCTYSIIENHNEPLFGSRLIGNINYKWGPWPASWGDFRIWAWYKGQRTNILDQGLWLVGDTGTIEINRSFTPQAIDALEFNLACWGTNIHIENVICLLTY